MEKLAQLGPSPGTPSIDLDGLSVGLLGLVKPVQSLVEKLAQLSPAPRDIWLDLDGLSVGLLGLMRRPTQLVHYTKHSPSPRVKLPEFNGPCGLRRRFVAAAQGNERVGQTCSRPAIPGLHGYGPAEHVLSLLRSLLHLQKLKSLVQQLLYFGVPLLWRPKAVELAFEFVRRIFLCKKLGWGVAEEVVAVLLCGQFVEQGAVGFVVVFATIRVQGARFAGDGRGSVHEGLACVEVDHEVDDGADAAVALLAAAHEVIDIEEAFGHLVALTPGLFFDDDDGPSVDEPQELGAGLVDVDSGDVCDLARGGGVPYGRQGQEEAPLEGGQGFDAGPEVVGVVVDEVEKVLHKLPKRLGHVECGYHGDQARAAPREDLDWANLQSGEFLSCEVLPQDTAVLCVEGFQLEGVEQFKHGLAFVGEDLVLGSGRAEQHDAGLVQQSMADDPSVVFTDAFPEQVVQVLGQEQEALAVFVGKIGELGEGPFPKTGFLSLIVKKVPVGPEPTRFGVFCGLPDVAQRLKPKLPRGEDLVGVLGEGYDVPILAQMFVRTDGRTNPAQEHGLAAPAGSDYEDVLVRRPRILGDPLEDQLQFGLAYHESLDQFLVCEETRVVFHNGGRHGSSPLFAAGV